MRVDRGLAAALALAGASFAVMLVSTWRVAWVPPDAANYGIVARSLLAGQGFTENVVPFHPGTFESVRHVPELHGLLRPFVLAPLFAAFGESPAVLRLPPLAFAALSGVVVFLWGRRLFGDAGALLGCVLTVTNVSLAYFGMLATDDAGFAFFLVATLAAVDRALDSRSGRDFLAAGVLAALALLEKPEGLLLAAVLAAVPFFPPRPRLRAVALLWAPYAAALALYLVRNLVAYGSLGFRFGPLGWILRAQGYEGMMQRFERAPGLWETLTRLGPERVTALVGDGLRDLAVAVVPGPPWLLPNPFFTLATPAFLPALGLLGAVLLARRYGGPAALTGLTLAAATLLLGVLWHVELRFLAFLVPLTALWTGGLWAAVAHRLAGRSRSRAGRLVALALAVAIAVPGVWAFARAQRDIRRLPNLSPCEAALAWLDAHAAPGDRVLTFDPWFTSWHIGRDAVMIPSGGPAELAAVARRYDARWLLAWNMFTRPRTSRTVMQLGPRADGIAVTKTYEDRVCRVYRLAW